MQISDEINQRKQIIRQHQVTEHMRGLKKQIEVAEAKKREQEAYDKIPMGTILGKKISIIER